MPKVLNRHTDIIPPDAVYVGRPSDWGNPFLIGRDGTRDQVVDKYEIWLLNSSHILKIEELRGKDLVCYCAPDRCHADVLLKHANK